MHQTYVCSFSNWETGCGRMWTINVSASNHSQWDNPLDSLLCLGASGSLCIQYLSTGRPCKRDCMKPHGEKHHRRAVGSPSSPRCSFTTSTSHLPLTLLTFSIKFKEKWLGKETGSHSLTIGMAPWFPRGEAPQREAEQTDGRTDRHPRTHRLSVMERRQTQLQAVCVETF